MRAIKHSLVLILMFMLFSYNLCSAAPEFVHTYYTSAPNGTSGPIDWYLGTHRYIVVSNTGSIVFNLMAYGEDGRTQFFHYYIYDPRENKIMTFELGSNELVAQYQGVRVREDGPVKVDFFDIDESWRGIIPRLAVQEKLGFYKMIDFVQSFPNKITDFRKDKSQPIIPDTTLRKIEMSRQRLTVGNSGKE